MTAGSRRDDDIEPGDALDRAIDETLRGEMRAHAVDLRERVLAGLDEEVEAPPAWWRFVLRPAVLPAAGTVLLVVGVLLTWQHVDQTLTKIGARRPAPAVAVARPKPTAPAAPRTRPEAARASAVSPTAESTPARGRQGRAGDHLLAAASVLGLDAGSAPGAAGADAVLFGDDAERAQALPGAMAGDPGDPIKPMPPPRPIVIQPIVLAPIVMAPLVSTLVPASEAIPTVGDMARDPSGPGKSGGARQ